MPFRSKLESASRRHSSLLCVGLDPQADRLPGAWRGDARQLGRFCEAIVDATCDVACAYKPQVAYFAAEGAEDQLERLIAHIRRVAPEVPVILDAKRGDIGSTADQYAREAFERYQADAVTLSPYMGWDTVEPYLRWDGKGVYLLCRTSNPGGDDLQNRELAGGGRLYEAVAQAVGGPWAGDGRVGLVIGATYPAELARVRALAPSAPLLIPGIGAQGGDAAATLQALGAVGTPASGPVAINTSRAVLYASGGDDFADAARQAAQYWRALLNPA